MNCFKDVQFWILFIIGITMSLQQNVFGIVTSLYRHENNLPAETICEQRCLTPSCIHAASYILEKMNKSVNPCDDFYQFVCGNFSKEQTMAEGEEINLLAYTIEKEYYEKVFNDIREEIKPDDLTSVKKLKIYYQNCMNESDTEEEDIQVILNVIEKLGGWPVLLGNDWKGDDYHLEEMISKIHNARLEILFPFQILIYNDYLNSSKNMIYLYPVDTLITDDFFQKDNTLENMVLSLVEDVVLLGANFDTALKDMKDCLDFDIKLRAIKTPLSILLSEPSFRRRTSIKGLSKQYNNVPWLKIVNNALNASNIAVDENEPVIIVDSKFFAAIGQLLNRTSKRVLANYQISKPILKLVNAISKTPMNRVKREYECLKEIGQAFDVAVSATYIRKHFDKQIKKNLSEMVQHLKYQMRKNLELNTWMGNETRKYALEKLDAMNDVIAYPDEILDDAEVNNYFKDLQINHGNYIKTYLNVTGFITNKRYEKLKMPPGYWTQAAKVAVLASYFYVENKLIVLPGLLRNFMYQIDRPEYLNYGTIGCIIGHEITHAFDKEGKDFDKFGNRRHWWDESAVDEFDRKSKCMVDQYNNFTIAQIGLNIDGKRTLNENIADNDGIELAYKTYKKWANDNNITEMCLPGLDYTPQQMFWIADASSLCSKATDNYLRYQLETDTHSPPEARINVVFANNEHFANDFNCTIGSKMNPESKCNIW